MNITMKTAKQNDGTMVFVIATDNWAFFRKLEKIIPRTVARLQKKETSTDNETFGVIAMPEVKTRKAKAEVTVNPPKSKK